MSNSALVSYTKISPNSTNPRTNTIKKITIHHMAGNLTVESCGNIFAVSTAQASANYGIGTDGRVGLYVDESNRSWASSSSANDHQAITIEVANDEIGGDWHVSDTAYTKLIDLCVDICQRNGISQLTWTGDTSGTLTCHYMFTATACPGPYLKGKMADIADEVNARLGVSSDTSSGDVATAETSTDSGESASTTYSTIKKGSTGDDVKVAQTLLNAKGASLVVDGDFGTLTDTATRAFQTANGLDVDGIIGPNTWAALQSSGSQSIATASAPTVTRTMIQKGSKGDDVTYLQTTLNAKGYSCGTVDGVFGVKTDAAVRAFQRDNGLDVDGIVGPKTWAKL